MTTSSCITVIKSNSSNTLSDNSSCENDNKSNNDSNELLNSEQYNNDNTNSVNNDNTTNNNVQNNKIINNSNQNNTLNNNTLSNTQSTVISNSNTLNNNIHSTSQETKIVENKQSIPNIIKDKIAILVTSNTDRNNSQNSLLNSLQANILLHDKEYVVFDLSYNAKAIENMIESLLEQDIMYVTICNSETNSSKSSLLKYFKNLFSKYNNEDIQYNLKDAGISIIDPNNITGTDVAKCGLLTTIKPSSQNIQDIANGIFVLNNLSKTNIGQSAISQLGKVIGIETELENTEQFIKRCINYKLDKRGGVLIKTTKPKQKENLIFPTIDCNTIIRAYEAKLDGIVINANYCRIIDINKTIKLANKRNIFILSI